MQGIGQIAAHAAQPVQEELLQSFCFCIGGKAIGIYLYAGFACLIPKRAIIFLTFLTMNNRSVLVIAINQPASAVPIKLSTITTINRREEEESHHPGANAPSIEIAPTIILGTRTLVSQI